MRSPFILVVAGVACVIAGSAQADWLPGLPFKWVQEPDLSFLGMDVDATAPVVLADDFECTVTGPITDIHVWGSWLQDILPLGGAEDVTFTLTLRADIPAWESPSGYSMPGGVLWTATFAPGQFTVLQWADNLEEGWYDPSTGNYLPIGDTVCWQYNFNITEDPFVQQGTPAAPVVYWLEVQAVPLDPEATFGWKTSLDPWNDSAVWALGAPGGPGPWNELLYPPFHPFADIPIDLAFVINGEDQGPDYKWSQPPSTNPESPFPECFWGWDEHSVYGWDTIVADDWLCEDDRPVTDVHWWGSYLYWDGEEPPDNAPQSFRIGVWMDVPAGVDQPWSHPGEMIWEWSVDRADLNETVAGCDFQPFYMEFPDTCFKYEFAIPELAWFYQEPGPTVYWISIAAEYAPCPCNGDLDDDGSVTGIDLAILQGCLGLPPIGPCAAADLDCDGVIGPNDEAILQCQLAVGWPDPACCVGVAPLPEYPWGWKTREHFFNDDAVRIWDPVAPVIGSNFVDGEPIEDPFEQSWDMAFVLLSRDEELLPEHELGDAPDSSNSFGVPMTAYPSGVLGNFPTVYLAGSPPHGPLHLSPLAVAHLGANVSLENEADIGPDQDILNNLDPPNDVADDDFDDDGVQLPTCLNHCDAASTFDFEVNVVTPGVPMFVNVWFDWDRDGDWDDIIVDPVCNLVEEWAVQNLVLNFASAGLYTVTTPPFTAWHPTDPPEGIWMRITLSELPWTSGGAAVGDGGSGPAAGYQFGETEDYYFIPASGTAPMVVAAGSVKQHGGVGPIAVDICSGATEPRSGGPTELTVVFDQAIQQISGTNADVAVSSGTVNAIVVAGTLLTVQMSGAQNAAPLLVTFPGIEGVGPCRMLSAGALCLRVLHGDVNNDGAVNVLDLVQVRNNLNTAVTVANFRADVSDDGSINVLDLVQVRNNLNTAVAPCPGPPCQ